MKSLKKNFIYNVLYQLLLILLPIITTPYVSRVLGVEGVGVYSYTYTVARYFVLFAMLGVQNYGNRSVAAVRDSREKLSSVFCQIYGLQFICACICGVLYYFFVFIFIDAEYRIISAIQGVYVLSAILDISWLFFGLEEFRITVTRNIIIKLISLSAIFLFVRERTDLWVYTLILTMGILLSQGYLWLYIGKYITWEFPAWVNMRKHLKPELVLFIPVIAISLYKMMDKVMLEWMSNVTQVGLYESTEKVINIPLGVITALGTVMLPRMSNLVANGKEAESRIYISHSLLFVSFLSAGMIFGISGISKELVPVFFGKEYLSCIVLLQVMTPTVCFIAWANVIRTQFLIPNHRDKSYTASVILGAFVNLIINMILIPHFQAMGAVIGTVCAEAVVCIYQTVSVRTELDVKWDLKQSVPFYFIGIFMFLMIRLLAKVNIGMTKKLILEILVGGSIFSLISVMYMILIKYPLMMGVFKKNKEEKEVNTK